MKSTQIKLVDRNKLTVYSKNTSCLHVNTNGGMGGGYYKIVGTVSKKLNALGLLEVECAVSKKIVQISPSWVSIIEPVVVLRNGNSYLLDFKQSTVSDHTGDVEVKCLESYDII